MVIYKLHPQQVSELRAQELEQKVRSRRKTDFPEVPVTILLEIQRSQWYRVPVVPEVCKQAPAVLVVLVVAVLAVLVACLALAKTENPARLTQEAAVAELVTAMATTAKAAAVAPVS